eukprot:gene21335-28271_t
MSSRSTLLCYVFGPHEAGKSALLKTLAADPDAYAYALSTLLCYVFGPHEAGKSALLKALAADPDAQSLSEEAGGGGGVSAPIVQGPASMRQANSASQSVPFITSHSSSSSQHLAPLMAMGAVGTDKERVMVMEEIAVGAVGTDKERVIVMEEMAVDAVGTDKE